MDPDSQTPTETDRVAALRAYGVLDTPPEPAIDEVAQLAAHLCRAPMALVSLVAEDRQWFKARVGLEVCQTPRSASFCNHAIRTDELFIVTDAAEDPRFSDNPLVTGPPHIRFYAGQPLITPDGHRLGTLCVIDDQPRLEGLDVTQTLALRTLAGQVMTQLELRRALRDRGETEERLRLALAAAENVGAWDWDVTNDRIVADAQFARFYGVDPEVAADGAPLASFISRIHPDDLERVTAEINAALDGLEAFESEYRLIGDTGENRWVFARGQVFGDEAGRAARFPGTVVDITARKQVEEELARAARALADSEARFRAIADTMPQMVWSALPDGLHDYYNARWYEFTGVPENSTDGEGWNGVFHPEDQARAWEVWRRSLETGEPYEIEYRLRHHSGVYRWTLGRALAIRDASGQVTRWFGTCTDIDDLKKAEHAKELLSQELSHRIKNIFAVVTALIGLSARQSPGAKVFADALRTRINALARAHDFVRPHTEASRPTLAGTTLHAFLRDLFDAYVGPDGERRVEIGGDDAVFDDQAATPVALLFHELATNAAKYGALSIDGGRVRLETVRRADRFILTWDERGGPPIAAPPTRTGFGSSLTSLSVESQLGGRLEREWRSEGLRLTADLPMSALARRRKAGKAATQPPVGSGVLSPDTNPSQTHDRSHTDH